MKQAILDTNFIITCVKQKIDFFEELRFMGLQVVVPKQVIAELERLVKTKKGAAKNQAELTLAILRANIPKLIDLKQNYVDKALINYSKKHKDIIIATLDSELKKKLKCNKIVIRNKKKLQIL